MALQALQESNSEPNEPMDDVSDPTAATSPTIQIDGSFDEGGGQILRNASAYSVILRRPISIENIRMKRDRVGLRPQHLTGLQLLQKLSEAAADGLAVGSTTVRFAPSTIRSGEFTADTETAGSIVLLIQSALPVLLFAPPGDSTLDLRGGTHATMAPPLDFFTEVFLPCLKLFAGIPDEVISLEVISRGYYPRGNGRCVLSVRPSLYKTKTGQRHLQAIEILERGDPIGISVRTFTSGRYSKDTTSKRLLAALHAGLAANFPGLAIDLASIADPITGDDAYGCLLVIQTTTGCRIASSCLGTYKTKPEGVANSAISDLVRNWGEGGAVDEHLQDQLIVFGTLAQGVTRVRCGQITAHTRTAMWLAEHVCGVKWTVEPDHGGENNVISCRGLGLEMPL